MPFEVSLQLLARRAALQQAMVDPLPERGRLIDSRIAQAAHLHLIGAQRHAEHVCRHLLPHPLRGQLTRQLQKDLIGDLRQGRAEPCGGGQLSDEHRRLTYDVVDQELHLHSINCSLASPAEGGAKSCACSTRKHPASGVLASWPHLARRYVISRSSSHLRSSLCSCHLPV